MNQMHVMPKRRFADRSPDSFYGVTGITRRAIDASKNNRARSLGPPNTLSQRLIQQKFGINPGNDMRRINAGGGMNTGAGSPTIRGWQNYTGKTMGEVGQYSRIPGFGRSFRG